MPDIPVLIVAFIVGFVAALFMMEHAGAVMVDGGKDGQPLIVRYHHKLYTLHLLEGQDERRP